MLRLAEKLNPTWKLIRLTPEVNEHWGYYKIFEDRVIDFAAKVSEEIPSDRLRLMLRKRWNETPELSFYYLVFKDNEPICHVAAWLENGWANPYALIFQAEADPHTTVREVMPDFLESFRAWIGGLNATYEMKNEPYRVAYVEMWTIADVAVWKRYFQSVGLDVYKERAVLRFRA